MKLSVVILNYNVRYFLELCLKSVQAATANIDAEIIVVDNNSEDDSCQMTKTLFPEVILIENNVNFGFSKGNNLGVSRAKGEWLCILNPDTVLAEDAFERILEFSESKENLGIVGCKLINGSGAFLPESKRNIPYVGVALKKIIGNSRDYYANHIKTNGEGQVDVLVGAFMFLKRRVFNEVNGFDEDYFMYGEDIDLSYRILKAGYKNYYLGSQTAIHFKGESTLKDRHYARRFFGAMQIFYDKHFKSNLFFDLVVWLGIKLAYFFRKARIPKRKSISAYIFISNKIDERLTRCLDHKVVLQKNATDFKNQSEIIFNGNELTFKEIIKAIENNQESNKQITFKILPKNSNFILGSDTGFSRGEVIELS